MHQEPVICSNGKINTLYKEVFAVQIQSTEKEMTLRTTDEPNGAFKVGQLLKTKREERKLSLEDVCEILKIRKFFLESIEKGRLDQLPGSVYTIGFVKVYSRFLDVNFEEISAGLIELTELPPAETPLSTYRIPAQQSLLTRWSIILSIFLVTSFLGYFYLTHERDAPRTPLHTVPMSEVKEETLPSSKQEETSITKEPQPQAQEADTQAITESSLVTIIATKETWIKITEGDNQLVAARLLRPGTYYRIESRPGLQLTAGEAASLQIYLGSAKLSRPIPQNAGLLESFPLDVENLKTYIDVEH